MVAVAIRGRTVGEVLCDMVDGVLVANRLEGEIALRIRASLLHAITASPSDALPNDSAAA